MSQSVCLSVTRLRCAKTVERIEMLFGVESGDSDTGLIVRMRVPITLRWWGSMRPLPSYFGLFFRSICACTCTCICNTIFFLWIWASSGPVFRFDDMETRYPTPHNKRNILRRNGTLSFLGCVEGTTCIMWPIAAGNPVAWCVCLFIMRLHCAKALNGSRSCLWLCGGDF